MEILEGIDYSFSIEYCTQSIAHHQSFQTEVSALCYCIYDPLTKTSSDCSVPGPTLIVYVGTTISMTWYNNLLTIGESVSSESFANQPKDLDITNIHLHGMHISPSEDNVLLEILPGESHQYIYNILPDHYPGTQWLHPHHHGSASLQIHGGLFSALLLRYKDRKDLMDDNLINMKENVLVFHFIYIVTTDLCDCNNETLWKNLYYYSPELNEQNCIEGKSCFVTFSYCYEYCSIPAQQRSVSGFKYDITTNYTDSQFLLFLVNGQFEPTIDDLTVNTFRRLRFINTYNQMYIQYLFPLLGCEWYLIAIDGIFLNDNEVRSLNQQPYLGEYILPPGGRIDVIVKCSELGTYYIKTTENNDKAETELETLTRAPEGNILFSIKVTNGDGLELDTVTEKPLIYPSRPDYLKDLRAETTDTMKQCACNTYNPENNPKLMPWSENECGLVFNMARSHNINGIQFDITTPMTYIDFNSVYEFLLILHMHPLHHHTNPFQIQGDVGTNGFVAKSGDWFDTFGVGKNVQVMMRMFTADFYGHQVVHCHILPHEARGQMTYYEILQSNQFCEEVSGEIITELMAMKEDIGVFDQDIDQVTIEMCLIKEAIPSPCSCGGDCSSVEYEYKAIVSEKCGDQVLVTGDYGAETCNPWNSVYEVGQRYKCKVLSCENGEFDVMDSANMMQFMPCLYIIGVVFYIMISCY